MPHKTESSVLLLAVNVFVSYRSQLHLRCGNFIFTFVTVARIHRQCFGSFIGLRQTQRAVRRSESVFSLEWHALRSPNVKWITVPPVAAAIRGANCLRMFVLLPKRNISTKFFVKFLIRQVSKRKWKLSFEFSFQWKRNFLCDVKAYRNFHRNVTAGELLEKFPHFIRMFFGFYSGDREKYEVETELIRSNRLNVQ